MLYSGSTDANALERILVLVKGKRDADVTRDLLERNGHAAVLCQNIEELCKEIAIGTAAVLLAEEVLTPDALGRLARLLARQPPWSDLPIVVFGAAGNGRTRTNGEVARALGNVTYLDRPVRVRSMLASVHAAIRSRRRQYDGRRAIDSRDVFLAMLGHELRNPLGAISFAIGKLEKTTPHDGRPKEYAIIDRQSRHLARLVDDLLDVARITQGKVTLQREVLNLVDVVTDAFEALESRARDHHLSFDLRILDSRISVEGDRKRLDQVFANIMANAIKYTPSAGGVVVEVRSEGGSAVVSVGDSGIGIAPEMLERIFDAFAQVDRSLERSEGGIGLGLALVRSVVQLHRGTVEAVSAGLGHGTTFIVRLPRVANVATSAVKSASEIKEPTHGRRVVVVEDNEDIRELLVELLELQGHDVAYAEDGPGGLAKVLDFEPDIAFIDVGLPGFDGLELATRARASGSTTHLVALTGYGQPGDEHAARNAGFDEHLTKPVLESDIQRVVRAVECKRLERPAMRQ